MSDITDLERENLEGEKIAIVGVGGTGSYILDVVSKMPVDRIDLFDGDVFLEPNARRCPGPTGERDIGVNKATLHARRYCETHCRVRGFDQCVDERNVAQLGDYDTVFLCIDGGPIKRSVLRVCKAANLLLIDVGMGLDFDNSASLEGLVSVTTGDDGEYAPIETCVALDAPRLGEGHQAPELNALNAAFAVIKWKKIRKIYVDGGERRSLYSLGRNAISNGFIGGVEAVDSIGPADTTSFSVMK